MSTPAATFQGERDPRFDILFEPVKIGPLDHQESLLSGSAL